MEAKALGIVVGIDGPSGSGKSTIARAVAKRLHGRYLDTGAMYRALTYKALERGINPEAEDGLVNLLQTLTISVPTDNNAEGLVVSGELLNQELRSDEVTLTVSHVAKHPLVRKEMVAQQRAVIAAARNAGISITAEGRDITTVVAPDADVRVLLTASEEERMRRRAAELGVDPQTLKQQIGGRDSIDETVNDLTNPAPGVTLIDSSGLSIEEVVEKIMELIPPQRLAEVAESDLTHEANLQAEVWEDALKAYDLDAEDLALVAGGEDAVEQNSGYTQQRVPVVAVIGRPNVGKSSLVNRIVGRRVAVVQDTPGVTRDRVTYPAEWAGHDFNVVDTGGWEVDVHGVDRAVAEQAQLAIDLADIVIFVVDARVGVTATDERVVKLLRKANKPVILAANKVDSAAQEPDAWSLWSLGIGEPLPISALHGRGTGDLLDRVVEQFASIDPRGQVQRSDIPRIAFVGRPNVGKSSLLNALIGEARVVVDNVAGTTRDPVDEVIELDDRPWVIVDTAGIRRRMYKSQGADFYASLRTRAAIENADVAVVLIDGSEVISEQDVRIVSAVVEAGRALVLVINKWDEVDEERQAELKAEIAKDLAHVSWAPRINLSALTTWHTNRLVPALDTALAGWRTRIPTGRLNAFLGELVAANPHPLRGGKQPRILFGTQASIEPPRFVLFTTGFLDPGYRRFIERRLREEFGFAGSPIQISVRVREKKRR